MNMYQICSATLENTLDEDAVILPRLPLDAHTLPLDTNPQSNRSAVRRHQGYI